MSPFPLPECDRTIRNHDYEVLSGARLVSALNESLPASSRSHRETSITAAVSASLRLRGVPMPRSVENRAALADSLRRTVFAATGIEGIALGDIHMANNVLVVPIEYNVSALFVGGALPENRTVPESEERDVSDVVYFVETAASVSIDFLDRFSSGRMSANGTAVPAIDCSDVTRSVMESHLCDNWRLDNAKSPKLSGRRAGERARTPGFFLVLTEALTEAQGEPLDLSQVGVESLTKTILLINRSTIVGGPSIAAGNLTAVGPNPSSTGSSEVAAHALGLIVGCSVAGSAVVIAFALYMTRRIARRGAVKPNPDVEAPEPAAAVVEATESETAVVKAPEPSAGGDSRTV